MEKIKREHQVAKTLPTEQGEGSSSPVYKLAELSALLCMAKKEPWKKACKTEPLKVPSVQAQSDTTILGLPQLQCL